MKNQEEFLKDKIGSPSDHHKEYLGMEIPEDYFSSSKANILGLVSKEKKETPVFYLRRSFQVAASITLLISIAMWTLFSNPDESAMPEIASDDILIESLFVEDIDMNQFISDVVVEEIMVEAEKDEQDLENIFINSLFVEDSLIDGYTKKSLIDNIIL
tara:strand:+ start:58074 stop:58547 length:474 start_codon:yes stop_codon:yes gene_type:complete